MKSQFEMEGRRRLRGPIEDGDEFNCDDETVGRTVAVWTGADVALHKVVASADNAEGACEAEVAPVWASEERCL